jgi:ADP-ribose pyrophosphatase YjhB (NUDIX family)
MERRIRLAAYAFCVTGGSLLLAQVSHRGDSVGMWTLPGGGLAFGEDPEAGMHRELYEETGLVGEIRSLLAVDSMLFSDTAGFPEEVHSVRIIYEVAAEGEPRVVETDGTIQDCRWVPLAEVPSYPVVSLVDFALHRAGLR